MIVAGEASGDLHGAHLIKAMQQRHPALDFYAIGGPSMQKAGAVILFAASRLSVVGITEVFGRLKDIFRGLRVARTFLKDHPPDLLILIDFPDFNLHLAEVARQYNIPVLYYISPQVWAWRPGRVRKIKKIVDHVAVILPFEETFYRAHRVPVTFVGHPLLDYTGEPFLLSGSRHAFSADTPVIGLLPGSRNSEVHRHLPVMLAAAGKVQAHRRGVRFIIAVAPSIEQQEIRSMIASAAVPGLQVDIDREGAVHAFGRCDLIVTASGTVTLEAALAGIPMLIMYKVSPVSYHLARTLIQVDTIGLVNLIAGRKIVPEFVQDEANPGILADSVLAMLNDPGKLENIRRDLLKIREKLGGSGASGRTAELALHMLK
jgi:lipid-A-disaccharide synthase